MSCGCRVDRYRLQFQSRSNIALNCCVSVRSRQPSCRIGVGGGQSVNDDGGSNDGRSIDEGAFFSRSFFFFHSGRAFPLIYSTPPTLPCIYTTFPKYTVYPKSLGESLDKICVTLDSPALLLEDGPRSFFLSTAFRWSFCRAIRLFFKGLFLVSFFFPVVFFLGPSLLPS